MAIDKDLQARLDKIEQIRADLKSAESSASKDIMTVLKNLMVSSPLLEGMRWRQYTPSFNDGDACEFGVHGPEFKFSATVTGEVDPEDEDSDDGWMDEWSVDDDFFNSKTDILNHEQMKELRKTVEDVETVFNKLTSMESQLQIMFGDGVQVTVTASGVETEDYDHD